MTELRKGQRAQIDVVIEDGERDEDGEVYVRLPTRGEGRLGVYVPVTALRFDEARPTYLARREAMVRALVQTGQHIGFDDDVIAARADALLRAIDETPVPEWAGGRHE